MIFFLNQNGRIKLQRICAQKNYKNIPKPLMEKSAQKLTTDFPIEKEKIFNHNEETKSNRKKIFKSFTTLEEVNSWDCSTPSDYGKTPKQKINDWDSISDCQETMVEAFDENFNSDDWDSDIEKSPKKSEMEDKKEKLFPENNLDSFINVFDVSETSVPNASLNSPKKVEELREEDLLLLEDFEEHAKDNADDINAKSEESPLSLPTTASITLTDKVRSNQSEGTPEDTTIWMIPKSERTESEESNSKLISSSDREKIEKLKRFNDFLKKTKSLSDMQKSSIRRRTARSSRSENLGPQKNNYNTFLLCEGSNLQRKLEIESKKSKENILGDEKFHRTRVFFTEYECKAITIEKDVPQKLSPTSSFSEREIPENVENSENNQDVRPVENDANRTEEKNNNEIEHPESSGIVSVFGNSCFCANKNSPKSPQNGGLKGTKMKPQESEARKSESERTVKTGLSESWFLFDEAGQYQEISKNEVSLLFNGRSAEAVLQGRTEHFIPTSTLKSTGSVKTSLTDIVRKESLQLREDDTGGDDEFKKLIDLERKVENTLLYIRPEADFKTSIRIIPIKAEMIHLWRRNKDGGTSSLSFEADSLSQTRDSTENANLRLNGNVSLSSRQFDEFAKEVEKEIQPSAPPASHSPITGATSSKEFQDSQSLDFSKMLIETKVIFDSLMNNFRILQNRLDGETNGNAGLQGELDRLRRLVNTCADNVACMDGNAKETGPATEFADPESPPSLPTDKASNKINMEKETEGARYQTDLETQDRSTSIGIADTAKTQDEDAPKGENAQDGNNFITVNIYTVEGVVPPVPFGENSQENYSAVESNLRIMERKMKRLQQENIIITKQNAEMKRKLKEISLELEKYLTSNSDPDLTTDESKELETLRSQMLCLRMELENLKMFARNQEDTLMEENFLVREEFTKSLSSLNDWCVMAGEIFKKIQIFKDKLQEIGITLELSLESDSIKNPKNFFNLLSCYFEQINRSLFEIKDENVLYEQALKDVRKESNDSKEIKGLDQVISGYSELIEQCRKGQINGETKNKVMEDYFTVIMEKASLMEEVKILKTENEMLLESQLEHYEKLKQTMIALKDRKNEITALESSQKLSEDEKTRMLEVLKLYEEEKKLIEAELLEKSKKFEDLVEEIKRKDLEIRDYGERLKAALNEMNNFEKTCRVKDEIINELRIENEELLNADGMKNNQIEILNDEIKKLDMRNSQFETELSSTKTFLNESQKEMTDYITHLEGLVNNSQESLEKTNKKLKESNQTINRLKNENDVLEKQHQYDLKLFNNTKDDLESCKEKLFKANNKLKESEEEQEKLHKKCEFLAASEKQKTEALESLAKEYKAALVENADLREKIEIYSRDKDELLSEQKDLINKYGLVSQEIQKLQEKYRNVKAECNERSDLIRYMEMMLKENVVEYNNRIVRLEQNISQIIEKIVAYKNGMREKHSGMDPEVKELRHQLNVTYQERKELENVVDNYYTLMKHLENEIQDREKKVDELHEKLSLEQQKAVDHESERIFRTSEASKSSDILKMEQLESQIAVTENELSECKRELQKCQTNYENEKKKLELTIADLKSEIKRYQLRIEVMMRNLSNCNKNGLIIEKRNEDDSNLQSLQKEIQEKDRKISELNDTLNKCNAEIKVKDSDLENLKKKSFYQNEELRNLQNQIAQLQDSVSTTNKSTEFQQKERDEMAEKLFQSIKLIMEERSARQTIESLALEKEKSFKNQIDQIKNELILKVKECETVSGTLNEKKQLVCKLQKDLKKMKAEMTTLKEQMSNYKKRNTSIANENFKKGEVQSPHMSNSLTQIKPQQVSPERLEWCLKELKEIRDLNLELRKLEGQYQAKIVRLEDEIRDARLLIKELQGDIKTEKKSKNAFKNMILAAKTEVEKCVMGKQLTSVVAERISRHLDLSEISSRELLSGFRLSDSSSSLKISS